MLMLIMMGFSSLQQNWGVFLPQRREHSWKSEEGCYKPEKCNPLAFQYWAVSPFVHGSSSGIHCNIMQSSCTLAHSSLKQLTIPIFPRFAWSRFPSEMQKPESSSRHLKSQMKLISAVCRLEFSGCQENTFKLPTLYLISIILYRSISNTNFCLGLRNHLV